MDSKALEVFLEQELDSVQSMIRHGDQAGHATAFIEYMEEDQTVLNMVHMPFTFSNEEEKAKQLQSIDIVGRASSLVVVAVESWFIDQRDKQKDLAISDHEGKREVLTFIWGTYDEVGFRGFEILRSEEGVEFEERLNPDHVKGNFYNTLKHVGIIPEDQRKEFLEKVVEPAGIKVKV